MGSDCSDDERDFKYQAFHQSIYAIENDIKKELYNQDISKKKYLPFGLINQRLCKNYTFLLNEIYNQNEARTKVFNYNDLLKKDDKRDFSYINPNFEFFFPIDFIFINKDFMDVIRDNVDQKYKGGLQTKFDTIIGGGCLIMKNPRDIKDEIPFRYIILYNEIKENKGNEIDFFLYIKDRNQRNEAIDYILKNTLWNFFKKIEYDYNNESKKIVGANQIEIGYIVRCTEVTLIENYKTKIIQKNDNNNNLKIQSGSVIKRQIKVPYVITSRNYNFNKELIGKDMNNFPKTLYQIQSNI